MYYRGAAAAILVYDITDKVYYFLFYFTIYYALEHCIHLLMYSIN